MTPNPAVNTDLAHKQGKPIANPAIDAGQVGRAGGGEVLQPLAAPLKAEMLPYPVLHTDETPVAMLEPGAGKTHRTYRYFEPAKAVVYGKRPANPG